MTFDEIPIRMLQLGVDRAWLAQECDYKRGTLAAILAPNGNEKAKTDKALRRIWEALDREEERQRLQSKLPEPLGHRVFIEPTESQFDRWMQAVYSQPGRTFDTWAKQGLDQIAQEELQSMRPTLKVAEEEGNASSPSIHANGVGKPPTKYHKKKSG